MPPHLTSAPRAAALQAAVLALLSLSAHPATAQEADGATDCPAEKQIHFRGGTLRIENDMFANTDRNYTSGVAVTAVSQDIAGQLQPECLPLAVRWHAQLIRWVNPQFWSGAEDDAVQNVVAKFGQSMYTPGDFSRSDLINDDRPYAGLLYVGLSWNRRTHEPSPQREVLDTREITLGVIGPWSLAEQSQNEVHDAIGSKRFHGWDNQLHNEPALQFAIDRKFKSFRGTGPVVPGFSLETIRTAGLRLGNIETSATLGIEGRAGWNLPNDFGSYPIRPGAENRAPSAASPRGHSADAIPAALRPRPGLHFFTTLEAKLVAYDFSLDGNLFRESHSVTRRPWVGQAGTGVSMHGLMGGHGFRLALMRVYRSPEFEEQRTRHVYGSIAFSVEW